MVREGLTICVQRTKLVPQNVEWSPIRDRWPPNHPGYGLLARKAAGER
jgi:hypothetical protein